MPVVTKPLNTPDVHDLVLRYWDLNTTTGKFSLMPRRFEVRFAWSPNDPPV